MLLAGSAASAAFVADWFVEALEPAMATIGMSEAFAGLIVVAVASNAIEHLAGVTAAWKNRGDLAMSLILNSTLQVVLFLAPVIVLLSFFVAPVPLTLIFDPLLLGTLVVTVLLVEAIVVDGEANAFEGAMLLGLYAIVGAAVWCGPAIGSVSGRRPVAAIRGTMPASMATWDELVRANGPIVADGAMGTMLMANGLEFGDPPELWNLEHPEIIRRVQRAYADAGAQVLLTNTFGGNRLRLELHGREDRVDQLNRTAAVLARVEANAADHAGPRRRRHRADAARSWPRSAARSRRRSPARSSPSRRARSPPAAST